MHYVFALTTMRPMWNNYTFAIIYQSSPEFLDLLLPHWYNQTAPDPIFLYLAGIYVTFIGLFGIIGNLFVIIVFSNFKSLRTPQNMLTINLAISDLAFSLTNGFPLKSIASFNHHWGWGKLMCDAYGFSGGLFGFGSLTTMMLVAIERYCSIVQYNQPSLQLTRRKAKFAVFFLWTWSLTWPSPPIFGFGRYVLEGFHTSCTFDYISQDWPNVVFNVGLYLFGFTTPVIIITFCYFEIVRFVRINERELMKLTARQDNPRYNRQMPGYRKVDVDAAKSSLIIVMLFLMSWSPYAIVCLTSILGYNRKLNPFLTELPGLFAKTSAVYNPVVYFIKNRRFRQKLWQRFKFCRWCLPKRKIYKGVTIVSKISGEFAESKMIHEEGEEEEEERSGIPPRPVDRTSEVILNTDLALVHYKRCNDGT